MTTQTTPATISVAQLRELVANLTAKFPASGKRAEHAGSIYLWRRVERSSGRGWWVQSENDDTEYFVLPVCCTCQDHQRHGHASPCKHALAVMIAEAAERIEADRDAPVAGGGSGASRPVGVDIYGESINYTLTPAAIALLDERRQRNAAKCPECGEYKQHGSLHCGGNRCARPALVVVA